MENDSENGGKRRSFVFSKRLNLTNEQRPKSLISYDSTGPPPMSPSALSGKSVPPVLARARSNYNTTGEVSSNVVNNSGSNNRRASLGPLEDLVLCGICLERLKNPKMLNCQHTFCAGCLESEFEEKLKLVCPTCNSDQNILNQQEIQNLPSNLYIDSLLKLLANPGPTGTAQVYMRVNFF